MQTFYLFASFANSHCDTNAWCNWKRDLHVRNADERSLRVLFKIEKRGL